MIIRFFTGEETLPVIPSGVMLGIFRIIPERDDTAGDMTFPYNRFMGRTVTVGTLGSILTQVNPVNEFGSANAGLETSGGLTLSLANTGVQIGTDISMFPFVRLLSSGAAGNGTEQFKLILNCAFRVDRALCIEARAGMPWVPGDDIIGR